jgi:hypothetical protein
MSAFTPLLVAERTGPNLNKSLPSQFVGRSPTLARNRQAKEPQSGWGRWSVEFEVQEVQEVQGATNELTR